MTAQAPPAVKTSKVEGLQEVKAPLQHVCLLALQDGPLSVLELRGAVERLTGRLQHISSVRWAAERLVERRAAVRVRDDPRHILYAARRST